MELDYSRSENVQLYYGVIGVIITYIRERSKELGDICEKSLKIIIYFSSDIVDVLPNDQCVFVPKNKDKLEFLFFKLCYALAIICGFVERWKD